MEFKDILRRLRIEKGMTQQELGSLVGLKKEAIYKYEKGIVVNPKRDLIAKFAKIFNVSPSYLLGIDDEATKQDVYSEAEKQLISDFRRLNEQGQEAAMGTVHAYTLMAIYAKKDGLKAGSM